MYSFTKEQCREVDRRACDEYGMNSLVLMENAGRGVVDCLCLLASGGGEEFIGPVTILCGKGNNAGDGFVMARHLNICGIETRVLLLDSSEFLQDDALVNFQILQKSNVPIYDLRKEGEELGKNNASILRQMLSHYSEGSTWLIDAMLGTGAHGEPREPLATAIDWFNAQDAAKAAVDVPSGLDCNTGATSGACVRADYTFTFVTAKTGFSTGGAEAFTGHIYILSIGVPPKLIEEVASDSTS